MKKPLSWWNNFATVSIGAGVTGLSKKSPQVRTGLEVALNLWSDFLYLQRISMINFVKNISLLAVVLSWTNTIKK